MLIPGFSRPIAPRKWNLRARFTSARSELRSSGTHTSASRVSRKKAGRITPITVRGRSLRMIVRPTIPESAPKVSCQAR
jgi:hypothetical protein